MNAAQKCKQLARLLLANALHYSGTITALRGREPSWRVLMYHRVTTPELLGHPMQPGMYVSPESFDMQLLYLREQAHIVGLDELVAQLAAGETPRPGTVAITFDDGWHDNFEYAFPILKKYEAPASIFLATSLIGSNATFWSDAIPYAIGVARKSPETLKAFSEQLPNSLNTDSKIVQYLQALLEINDAEFIDTLDVFVNDLKTLSEDDRKVFADTLCDIAKQVSGVDQPRAFMNWEEVKQMAGSRIHFGSHTHSHLTLPECSKEQIREELKLSYTSLEEQQLLASPVFCYPEGRYSEESQQVLAELGISYALTTKPTSQFSAHPPLIGRTGLHNDISRTPALLSARLWANPLF